MTASARDWKDIELHYTGSERDGSKNLLELVKHIKSSGLDKRIYAFTSHDKLVISIYSPVDPFKESLHVTFNADNGKWEFEYYAMPFQKPEFSRSYEAEKGIEKFDSFIKMVKW